MARTKAQVANFLNSQVGKKVNVKCGIYNGQCVSLIKALLEYVGAPNPYAGRGNAKDVGDTLLRQNIAEKGRGEVTVVVNRQMGNVGGVTYGHIWVDIPGVANYEQNGSKALRTTKNTRPLSQGQQFVNLDKWLKEEEEMVTKTGLAVIYRFLLGTTVSKYGLEHRLGKQTFDEAFRSILKSKAYKNKVARTKKSKEVDLNQFPAAIRGAIKK